MMEGILIVDKPTGLTSHDVCATLKRVLTCRRIGHTGTLDPLATGVLPILLNGATKWAGQFIADDKEYHVTAQFGATTTTYDREGEVTARMSLPADLSLAVAQALPRFRGELLQRPPAYSAVKHQGRPLYWWVRRGEIVNVKPRSVAIHSFEMVDGGAPLPTLQFRVTCSKGTYIRSLIHDLGVAVGSGAHVTALRRLRSGSFLIEDAVPLTSITLANFSKILYKNSAAMVA